MNPDIRNAIESPDADSARHMAETYPYFTPPMAAAIRAKVPLEPALARRLGQRVALSITSRADAADLLGADSTPEPFYPPEPEPERPDTPSAIDTFIEQFGPSDPRELEIMSRVIFNPRPSYAATIGAEAAADNHDSLIPPTPVTPPAPPESPTPEASPKLMQSLAMMMVRKHNYTKALEIIQQLSLKYPEKNFIFADQIRFINKLIDNENQVNTRK